MELALEEAKAAAARGEVPVGALIIRGDEILGRSGNEVEQTPDASAHAEILAIRAASLRLGVWRLDDTKLIVTLEPCPMCISAVVLARIPEVYFGAADPRLGACGSLFDLSSHPTLPHHPKVFSGVLEQECSALLKTFFQKLRT